MVNSLFANDVFPVVLLIMVVVQIVVYCAVSMIVRVTELQTEFDDRLCW